MWKIISAIYNFSELKIFAMIDAKIQSLLNFHFYSMSNTEYSSTYDTQ